MQICTLGPGSFFGYEEDEENKGKSYEYSAITVTDAKIYYMDINILLKPENSEILEMIK